MNPRYILGVEGSRGTEVNDRYPRYYFSFYTRDLGF